MERISVKKAGSRKFIIAADDLFSSIHPDCDHVWELNLEGAHRTPILLETTYGLQAASMQLIPSLYKNKRQLLRTGEFVHDLEITHYSPAFLRLRAILKHQVSILIDIFIPEGDVLLGNICIENNNPTQLDLTFEMAAILVPMGKGLPTQPEKEGVHHIIAGRTADLHPVLYMSGGPEGVNNPYPALTAPISIPPNQSHSLRWALASQTDRLLSYEKARAALAKNWQSDAHQQWIAHEKHTLHIHTGEPDWDAAFSLAQTTIMNHLVMPSKDQPAFTRSRLPDQAASRPEESGNEHRLSTLALNHLSQILLPAHVGLIKEVLLQYIDHNQDGHLAVHQTSPKFNSFPEPPLLANLCLEIYKICSDQDFLAKMYPTLCDCVDFWFKKCGASPEIPRLSWQSSQQLQIDPGLFLFDIWNETGKGLDITRVESPALAAILLREIKALITISKLLGSEQKMAHDQAAADALETDLQSFWVEARHIFNYRDKDSKLSPSRELYYPGRVQERITFHKTFFAPQRLLCHLTTEDEHTKTCTLILKGKGADGSEIEEIHKNQDIRWVMGRAHITTNHLYQHLDSISITGLAKDDRILIETADLSQADISCLLPVWSGGMDETQITTLLETVLDPHAPQLKSGIPETWKCTYDLPEALSVEVNVLWNTLIIEGIAQQGHRQAAKDLFTNLMNTIAQGLKDFNGFFQNFEVERKRPVGQRNVMTGLVPIRLFLEISGIKLFSPNQVAIWGKNPFPWPIEIRWQGLSLTRQDNQTRIVFPNGMQYESLSEEPVIVTPAILKGGSDEHVQ